MSGISRSTGRSVDLSTLTPRLPLRGSRKQTKWQQKGTLFGQKAEIRDKLRHRENMLYT